MVNKPRILLINAETYGPALAERLEGLGASVRLAGAADLTVDDTGLYGPALERVADQAYAAMGGVDTVVFCDRVRQVYTGLADPEEILAAATDTTKRLLAAVRCLATRIIKDRVGGQFVLICDVAAVAGRVGFLPAATSGGALVGMGKSIAKEFGRRGLAVNIICHGLMEGIDSGAAYTEAEAMMLKATGMGKCGNLGHLAGNIMHLAGGGHWINGQVLQVSDGLVT